MAKSGSLLFYGLLRALPPTHTNEVGLPFEISHEWKTFIQNVSLLYIWKPWSKIRETQGYKETEKINGNDEK